MHTSRWLTRLGLFVALSALALPGCEKKAEEANDDKTKQEQPAGEGEAGATTEETAPAEEPAAAEEDPGERDDDYASGMCGLYQGCYDKFEFAGQTTGKITADVDEAGALSNVTFEGDAPKPVEQCLLDAVGAHKVADYVGGTGTMTCSWTGQLMAGGGMIQQSWGFERKTEPAP